MILEELGVQMTPYWQWRRTRAHCAGGQYFVEKRLYPNVDFYSGIILKAIGIPVNVHRYLRDRPHPAGFALV